MARARSRAAAAVVMFLAALLLVAPAASADTTTPTTYHAKADSTALQLLVFGQGLTLGVTHAENASDPASAALGLGALVPVIGNQVAQTAAATTDAPSEDHPQACGPVTLPADFPVLSLSTACSAAKAIIDGGFPNSVGDASVASIDVNANAVLGQVTGPLNQPIGDLLTGLQPVLDAVNQQSGVDAQSLLNQVIAAINEDGDLIKISLGPSQSTSGADAAT